MQRLRGAGFTLLELLVVLALMAFAVGLAAPAVSHWLDNAAARAWRSELRTVLATLPVKAYGQGNDLHWDEAALRKAVPSLPATVELKLSKPLHYSGMGVATANELSIHVAGARPEVWRILGLTGDVQTTGLSDGALP